MAVAAQEEGAVAAGDAAGSSADAGAEGGGRGRVCSAASRHRSGDADGFWEGRTGGGGEASGAAILPWQRWRLRHGPQRPFLRQPLQRRPPPPRNCCRKALLRLLLRRRRRPVGWTCSGGHACLSESPAKAKDEGSGWGRDTKEDRVGGGPVGKEGTALQQCDRW